MKCLLCSNKMHLFLRDLLDDRYKAPGKYSIYFCSKCNFAKTFPILKKNKIGTLYSSNYPLKDLTPQAVKSQAKIFPYLIRWLFGINITAHYYIKPGDTVLDLGSGSGVSLLEIKQLGGIPFGIEPDHNTQKIAKALKLRVYEGFITANPYPYQLFNAITASQVIEHDPNPVRFLNAALNKLNPNGRIILSCPNFNSASRKLLGRSWIHWHVPYHQNYFSKKAIIKLASKFGLVPVFIKTITPNIWSVLQLKTILLKISGRSPKSIWYQNSTRQSRILNYFLLVLLILPNRLIDILGMGDGILVEFRRKINKS